MGSGFFLVLLGMFAIMYFLLIRPQRQQQRRHAEMLNQLKVGDEVIVGGIYGEVVQLDTERVMLEIDDDVRVAVARRAIGSVVPPEELERLETDEEEGPGELPEGVEAEEPLTAEERSRS